MQVIAVSKQELLTRLRENRDKHRAVFSAAIEGYRADAIEQLDRKITRLNAGKLPDLYIDLVRPEDHTRDYARIIEMVTMHLGETFELSENDFKYYVMDDWGWKREFVKLSSSYAAASVREAYGENDGE